MTLTRDVVGVTLRDVVTSYNVTLRGAELHIQNVNRSDQLNYICTIANSLGHSNATIFVRVKGTRKPTTLQCCWKLMTIMAVTALLGFKCECMTGRCRSGCP